MAISAWASLCSSSSGFVPSSRCTGLRITGFCEWLVTALSSQPRRSQPSQARYADISAIAGDVPDNPQLVRGGRVPARWAASTLVPGLSPHHKILDSGHYLRWAIISPPLGQDRGQSGTTSLVGVHPATLICLKPLTRRQLRILEPFSPEPEPPTRKGCASPHAPSPHAWTPALHRPTTTHQPCTAKLAPISAGQGLRTLHSTVHKHPTERPPARR